MEADVDDDPGRAQRLAVEHAEAVGGVVEVAELVHEPLGVQRPALAAAGDPAELALPAVEQVATVGGLGDLQVVPGHALVEDRGDLAPRGEAGDARRHRPPHAARAGEVLARAGVVDAAVLGGREAALEAADRVGDLEVHVPASSARVRSESSCIQSRNASLPSMLRSGSASSSAAASSIDAAGHVAVGDGEHLGLDAVQLLPAPGVGLLEVDRRAEEVAAGELVALAADGVGVQAHAARARSRGTGRRRRPRRSRRPRGAAARP